MQLNYSLVMVENNVNFDNQVIKEALLYILEKEGRIRYYALMKTLYLAERDHLAQWGGRITSDVYHPLPYGPVPSRIYDALKSINCSFLCDVLTVKNTYVSALRKPDMQYLSQSEVYALDRAIQFVRTHNFEEIKTATHDQFYQAAKTAKRAMTEQEIALSGGATDGMIAYLKEQQSVEKALL